MVGDVLLEEAVALPKGEYLEEDSRHRGVVLVVLDGQPISSDGLQFVGGDGVGDVVGGHRSCAVDVDERGEERRVLRYHDEVRVLDRW